MVRKYPIGIIIAGVILIASFVFGFSGWMATKDRKTHQNSKYSLKKQEGKSGLLE